MRLSKFPVLNETVPLGDPEEPVLTAENFFVDEGQNQSESGEAQFGSTLEEGEGKNRPFEPVSKKLL